MDYPEVLTYLYEQLPMFQKVGASAFKKNLDNTLALCEALDNPHKKFKSIHVGGTNGKGSSSHMLAACFQSAGYRTGLYTSPHLKEFTERIKIDGVEISKESVVDFVLKRRGLIEKIQPSFFELTVVMAFDYFATEGVDIAIIEVGLGGRLDSTNVIQPLVSLITNISYDHQTLLGNSLREIAFEKAGIIKKDTPVVISESQEEVKEVFINKAVQEHAEIFFADQYYQVEEKSRSHSFLEVEVHNFLKGSTDILLSELTGGYQLKNIKGILKAIDIINHKSFTINHEAIAEGLKKVTQITGLKGRWQKLNDKPLIICDTGHNEEGIKEVLKQISLTPHKNLFIIIGVVKDKDVSKILSLLPRDAFYVFCEANIPRSLPAEDLYKIATPLGLRGEVIKDVNDAIEEAKRKASQEDLIFVGGSNFVVAEINNL